MPNDDYKILSPLEVFGTLNSSVASMFIKGRKTLGQVEEDFGFNFLELSSVRSSLYKRGLEKNQIEDIIKNFNSAYTLHLYASRERKIIKDSKKDDEKEYVTEDEINEPKPVKQKRKYTRSQKPLDKPNIPSGSLEDILLNAAIKTRKENGVILSKPKDRVTSSILTYSFESIDRVKLEEFSIDNNYNLDNPLIAFSSTNRYLELLIVDFPVLSSKAMSINQNFPASKTKLYFGEEDKNSFKFNFIEDDVIVKTSSELNDGEYVLRERIKKIEFKLEKESMIKAYSVKEELIPSVLTRIIKEGIEKINSEVFDIGKKSYEEIMSSLRREKIKRFQNLNPEVFARQILTFHISKQIRPAEKIKTG